MISVGGYVMLDCTGIDISNPAQTTIENFGNRLQEALDSKKPIVLVGLVDGANAVSPTFATVSDGTITFDGGTLSVSDSKVTPRKTSETLNAMMETGSKNRFAPAAKVGKSSATADTSYTDSTTKCKVTCKSDGTIEIERTDNYTGTGTLTVYLYTSTPDAIHIDDFCTGEYYFVAGAESVTGITWKLGTIKSGILRYDVIPDKGAATDIYIQINISKDFTQAMGKVTFAPMIQSKYISDLTFMPYAPTNAELYTMIQNL